MDPLPDSGIDATMLTSPVEGSHVGGRKAAGRGSKAGSRHPPATAGMRLLSPSRLAGHGKPGRAPD
jgi:hypothetical protein